MGTPSHSQGIPKLSSAEIIFSPIRALQAGGIKLLLYVGSPIAVVGVVWFLLINFVTDEIELMLEKGDPTAPYLNAIFIVLVSIIPIPVVLGSIVLPIRLMWKNLSIPLGSYVLELMPTIRDALRASHRVLRSRLTMFVPPAALGFLFWFATHHQIPKSGHAVLWILSVVVAAMFLYQLLWCIYTVVLALAVDIDVGEVAPLTPLLLRQRPGETWAVFLISILLIGGGVGSIMFLSVWGLGIAMLLFAFGVWYLIAGLSFCSLEACEEHLLSTGKTLRG